MSEDGSPQPESSVLRTGAAVGLVSALVAAVLAGAGWALFSL